MINTSIGGTSKHSSRTASIAVDSFFLINWKFQIPLPRKQLVCEPPARALPSILISRNGGFPSALLRSSSILTKDVFPDWTNFRMSCKALIVNNLKHGVSSVVRQ